MRKSKMFWIGVIAGFFVMTLGLSGTAVAEEPIKIGFQSDYAKLVTIGPVLFQGFKDYIKVFESEGGKVEGHPIEFVECTHDYDVNRGLECYQRQKMAGIVSLALYGTPHTYALTPKLTADKIPAICAGFGRADAMDGTKFPYIFPVSATYWSQATAAVKYIQDAEGKENLKGVKIAYLYFDNPAGKEPMGVLEKLAKKFQFKLRMFGVPSPGVEMGAQVTDITRRFKADWVIGHMFGRAPSVSLKELYRKGFPLDHYIAFVWNTFDTDVEAAGKDISKGCLTISYTGLGNDFPIHKKIKALYEKEGKPVPEYFNKTGYYNRGIYWAGIQVEAVRMAIKHYGPPITGETVKKGYEKISGYTLGGLFPPLELSENDHEGGGWVIVYQWDGEKFVLKKDWYKAHRDIIAEQLAEVNKAQK